MGIQGDVVKSAGQGVKGRTKLAEKSWGERKRGRRGNLTAPGPPIYAGAEPGLGGLQVQTAGKEYRGRTFSQRERGGSLGGGEKGVCVAVFPGVMEERPTKIVLP